MKRIAAHFTLLMMVVLLFTAASYAQFAQHLVLKGDVPFEFSVGDKTFPAGTYQLVQIGPHTLVLRDHKNAVLTSVMTTPVVSLTRSKAKLKFKFEGGRQVLSEAWPDGETTGYRLADPKPLVNVVQDGTQNLAPGPGGR